MTFGQIRIWILLPLLIAVAVEAQAQSTNCNARLAAPSLTISVPGNPFGVLPSRDGCWVFASVGGAKPGIAVLKHSRGRIEMMNVAPLPSGPAGIALTHDGELLIASAGSAVVLLDVAQLTAGGPNPMWAPIAIRSISSKASM